MSILSSIFGGGDNGRPPETREALRNATRRDPHMKENSRDARRSLFGNSRDDDRDGADSRDSGRFWSW